MDSTFLVWCLALAALGLAIRLALPRVLAWRGVDFTWHTRFGPALVFDAPDQDGTMVRLLNVAGTYQSVCYVDDDLLWLPVCAYHLTWADAVKKTMRRLRRLESDNKCALVLGGGGYSFPKWLVAATDLTVTVVEIDPAITDIARRQFFLDRLLDQFGEERLRLVEGDAWAYLQETQEVFAVVVNDVFSKNRPLGPLATDVGARLVAEHLVPGGLYIGNVRCALEGRGATVLAETTAAFEAVFDHVRVVCERPEEPRKVGNNALIAWMDGRTQGGVRWQT